MSITNLTPYDLEMFQRIGVGEELLAPAQVRRVTDEEAHREYGISFNGDLSGIIFPYLSPATGHRVTARLRRDKPEVDSEGKVKNKYICPYGDNRHLYFPPGSGQLLNDVTVPLVVVEAEKSALALTALAAEHGRQLLTIGTGGCWGWRGKTGITSGPNGERSEERGPLADFQLVTTNGRKVLVAFDSNVASNPKVQDARRALADVFRSRSATVLFVNLPEENGVNGPDDYIARAGGNAMLALLDCALPSNAEPNSLRVVSAREFLAMVIRPREMLLSPILPEKALAMIHGRRGVGKTHIALGIAVAVASGGNFLKWQAPRPRKVLYIDGELPSALLQEWLAETVCAVGQEAVSENLRILTPDFQERGIPDLATVGGQVALTDQVAWADFILLDNLSSLVRSGKENEAEGWLPVQEWALSLRRAGKSVQFVHHSGRNLNQRGTSKREDLLDTMIGLRQPVNYNPSEGLRVEVHFEKHRHFHGEDAEPFEVSLVADPSGKQQWVVTPLKVSQSARAAELFSQGCDVGGVMEELGVSRATAFRLRRQFKQGQSQVSSSNG